MLCAITMALVAACASESDHSPPHLSDAAAREKLFADLAARSADADSIWYADDLGDYLPIQTIRFDGRAPKQFSPAGVVRGDVINAEMVAAYRLGGFGADGEERAPTRVRGDAPAADWRIAQITLDVEQAWSSDVAAGDAITLDLSTFDSNTNATVQALESLDDAIIVLESDSQIGDSDYSIALNGELLGHIVDGRVTFPGLGSRSESAFVSSLTTPADLTAAAKKRQNPIVVSEYIVTDTGDD